MLNANQLTELLTPAIEDAGFETVRIRVTGSREKTLQIMAERPDGTMSVDDCAQLSREVSLILDVEDPLPGEYLLEVSSPGVDRPLTRPKDFERWVGFETKVELANQIDGRRRFKGRMTAFNGSEVVMDTEEGQVVLPFAEVSKAKLILTDELLDAVQKAAANKDESTQH